MDSPDVRENHDPSIEFRPFTSPSAPHAPVEDADTAAKVAMQKAEAQEFAGRNAFKIERGQPILARCVDGRYSPEDARKAPLSTPGADPGYVLAAFSALRNLGVTVSPEEVWNKVMAAVGGEGNFRFHTDDHHMKDGAARGCGHLNLANTNPKTYGVTADEMDFLFEKLDKLAEKHPDHQIMLKGDHLERAVLVINSPTHGVACREPFTGPGGRDNQAFVFQKTLHKERMGLLAGSLLNLPAVAGAVKPEALLDALNKAFERQLTATLADLAPGDPVHEITL